MPDDHLLCSCSRFNGPPKALSGLVEEQLLLAEGGDSPELYRHLRQTRYDLLVFVGLHNPVTYWGAKALPDDRRMMLVPATTDEDVIQLGVHNETLERAERLIVSTEHERSLWTERLVGERKIENIQFLVGVNPLARHTDPHDFDRERYVIVAQDWTVATPVALTRLSHWAEVIEQEVHPGIRLRVVGPGSDRHPLGIPLTTSRLDIWRWMSRAMLVLDPVPQRLLGRQVLEAFLYRVPVVVHARGGASREHAEAGNGGLWFRTDDELCAAVRALLDNDLAQVLGEQGCAYAQRRYADTDSFIKSVAKVCLS
jgi:glycosyltransferase involved in cell wall biosynthesis